MSVASKIFTNGTYRSPMEKQIFDGPGACAELKSETSSAVRSLAEELAQIVVSEIQKIIDENPNKRIRFVSGKSKFKTARKVIK